MVTNELIAFIKSELQKGSSREQIHKLLVTHGGWKEEDMAEAFALAAPTPTPAPEPAPTPAPTPTPAPMPEPTPAVTAASAITSAPVAAPITTSPAQPQPLFEQPASTNAPAQSPVHEPTVQEQVAGALAASHTAQSPMQPAAAVPEALPHEPLVAASLPASNPAPTTAAIQSPAAAVQSSFVATSPLSQPIGAAVAAPATLAKQHRYFWRGILLCVVALVVSLGTTAVAFKKAQPFLFSNQSVLFTSLGVECIMLIIGIVLNCTIVYRLSKTFSTSMPSWRSALLLASISQLAGAIILVLKDSALASGLLLIGIIAVSIIVFIIAAERAYAISAGKAFMLWFASLAFGFLAIVVATNIFSFVTRGTSGALGPLPTGSMQQLPPQTNGFQFNQ
jgi:hypothetical protein